MEQPLGPRRGDIVIRSVKNPGGYTVEQFPGTPQVTTDSYEAAVATARSFAKTRHVLLWNEQDGSYTRIDIDDVHGAARAYS